jgi:hypothetical protein
MCLLLAAIIHMYEKRFSVDAALERGIQECKEKIKKYAEMDVHAKEGSLDRYTYHELVMFANNRGLERLVQTKEGLALAIQQAYDE